MPITITLPESTHIGPGLTLQVSTDLVGPIPVDAEWDFTIAKDVEGISPYLTWVLKDGGKRTSQSTILVWEKGELVTEFPLRIPIASQAMHVFVNLRTSSGVVDSGTTFTSWNVEEGIGAQAYALKQGSTALTPTEKQQLTDTERRTQLLGEPTDLIIDQASGPLQTTLAALFSRKTLDQLTLLPVTDGETCEPVRTIVNLWFSAVIVRVTTISFDLLPRTPDKEWYFPDLAVLRVFRGGDLLFRRGIHTPTFMVNQPWQWSWPVLNEIPILGVPPDITVAVDWREGCCGEVFLFAWP